MGIFGASQDSQSSRDSVTQTQLQGLVESKAHQHELSQASFQSVASAGARSTRQPPFHALGGERSIGIWPPRFVCTLEMMKGWQQRSLTARNYEPGGGP